MKQKKSWIFILIAIAVVVAATALVIASFIMRSAKVKNTFIPADSVVPEIKETFNDNKLKENVYFKVGETDYPVYVRAAIAVTWKNAEDGTVYFSNPIEGIHYNISLNDTDWKEIESTTEAGKGYSYYYLTKPVESGGTTPYLIYECEQILMDENVPEEYTLSVEIIVQTVQAVGSTDENNPNGVIPAYQDAWGIQENLEEPKKPETSADTE